MQLGLYKDLTEARSPGHKFIQVQSDALLNLKIRSFTNPKVIYRNRGLSTCTDGNPSK